MVTLKPNLTGGTVAAKITFALDPATDPKPDVVTCALPDGTAFDVTAKFGTSGKYETDDPVEVTILDSLFSVVRADEAPAAKPKSKSTAEDAS
jgi:hypothetical protein